jgi:PTH1 family peptidyl-tRNA hydrolase
MKIIVGLGNPGFTYRRTRHNLGFMVAKLVTEQRGIRFHRGRWKCALGEGSIGKEEVVLVRPLTFMNASGECVAAVMKHYQRDLPDLLVVCDDVALDLGRLRVRRAGSAGGHKGISSIIHSLHSQEFARLRLGVGEPPEGRDMMSYVLAPFRRNEWPTVHEMLDRAAQAVETWVYYGAEEAMNRFNQPGQGGPL